MEKDSKRGFKRRTATIHLRNVQAKHRLSKRAERRVSRSYIVAYLAPIISHTSVIPCSRCVAFASINIGITKIFQATNVRDEDFESRKASKATRNEFKVDGLDENRIISFLGFSTSRRSFEFSCLECQKFSRTCNGNVPIVGSFNPMGTAFNLCRSTNACPKSS